MRRLPDMPAGIADARGCLPRATPACVAASRLPPTRARPAVSAGDRTLAGYPFGPGPASFRAVADISTIAQLSGLITSQLSEVTRQLMIDVSGLHFADSAAIALLLLVARTLKGQGGSMMRRGRSSTTRSVLLATYRS